MEFEFNKWLTIKEMSGFMTADLSNVNLTSDDDEYAYDFKVDGRNYNVDFIGPRSWTVWTDGGQVDLAHNRFSIGFTHGAAGYTSMPRDTKNPTAVYQEVFKAIRKLIQVANPDCFNFYGSSYEQDVMYDLFYRKYLHKGFTRIGSDYYLRNDLYEQYKKANGPQWKVIQDVEKQDKDYTQTRIKLGQTARNKDRKERLAALKNPKEETPWQGITSSGQQWAPSSAQMHPPSQMQMHGMQRGQRTPQGGLYVGTSPTGLDWVSYDDSQYDDMVRRFDLQYGQKT